MKQKKYSMLFFLIFSCFLSVMAYGEYYPNTIEATVGRREEVLRLITIYNDTSKNKTYDVSYILTYVDEFGSEVELEPIYAPTRYDVKPRVNVTVGGYSRYPRSSVGLEVSSNRSRESGLIMPKTLTVKKHSDKALSINIRLDAMVIKDNPKVRIDRGLLRGAVILRNRSNKKDFIEIPIEINWI